MKRMETMSVLLMVVFVMFANIGLAAELKNSRDRNSQRPYS